MLVKIYADCNHEFRVGSGCGLVQIRDRISIPEGCYGVFFVRKSLAVKGLSSPHCIFHSQWEGVPTIALMFNGVNIVEIRAGDEIGELLIQPILAVKGMDLSSFQNIRREKTFGQLMEKGEELEAERKVRIGDILNTNPRDLAAMGGTIRQYHAKLLTPANTPLHPIELKGDDIPKQVKEWYDDLCKRVFAGTLRGSSNSHLILKVLDSLMGYGDLNSKLETETVEQLRSILCDLAHIRYNQLISGGLNMKEAMILNGIIDVLKFILFIEERPANGK